MTEDIATNAKKYDFDQCLISSAARMLLGIGYNCENRENEVVAGNIISQILHKFHSTKPQLVPLKLKRRCLFVNFITHYFFSFTMNEYWCPSECRLNNGWKIMFICNINS